MGKRKPVRVLGPKDPKSGMIFNVTSHSTDMGRQCSPFLMGPVPVELDGKTWNARNMENAWQYSKVYKEHLGNYEKWKIWALGGFVNPRAIRYPMGKGAKPEFHYWKGEKLAYIQARKKIYIPEYAKLVVQTNAFRTLRDMYKSGRPVALWDFDGYNHRKLDMSFHEVIHCETRTMGHAFVIAMLLERYIDECGNVV